MTDRQIENIITSILFVAGEAVSTANLAAVCEMEHDEFLSVCERIIAKKQQEQEGLLIARFEDKLRLCTNQQYAPFIKRLLAPEVTERLTNAVLETLSIIAYRQPVTRSEIESIRGVRCDYAVSTLIEKGMVREVGRKDVVGRPILLGTTDDFLKHFGISSLSELPPVSMDTPDHAEELFD